MSDMFPSDRHEGKLEVNLDGLDERARAALPYAGAFAFMILVALAATHLIKSSHEAPVVSHSVEANAR